MSNELLNLLDNFKPIFQGEMFPFVVVGSFFIMLGLAFRITTFVQDKYKKYRYNRAINSIKLGDMVIYKYNEESSFGLVEERGTNSLLVVEPFSHLKTVVYLDQVQTRIPKHFFQNKKFNHELKNIWDKYDFKNKRFYNPYSFLEMKLNDEVFKEKQREHLDLEVGYFYWIKLRGHESCWGLVLGRQPSGYRNELRTMVLVNRYGKATLLSDRFIEKVSFKKCIKAEPVKSVFLKIDERDKDKIGGDVYGFYDLGDDDQVLYIRTGKKDSSWGCVNTTYWEREKDDEYKEECECI